MIISTERWAGIPLLHIVRKEEQHTPIPTVIFLHGFTSAKEHNLHYAYNLAQQGIRVILPDALLHGERAENLEDYELRLRFWEIVLNSIREVDLLRYELRKRELDQGQPIGIGGTSMGGITSFGCLASYEWISAASIMMGSPAFTKLAAGQISYAERGGVKLPITDEEREELFQMLERVDLSKAPEKLNERPLFLWHGEQDSVVPFELTEKFTEDIRPAYAKVPERLKWVPDEEAGHAVTRQGMLQSVHWLAEHLNEARVLW